MITLNNNQLTVQINEFGAEVSSVADRKTGYEFIWQANKEFWGRHAPVLFPIVGRLKADRYQYDGKNYTMTQHGFARDSMFEVVEVTENTAIFLLENTTETLKVYPFEFRLLIKYVLEDTQLTVAYEVLNLSTSKVMYYGIGGHPAFNVSQMMTSNGYDEFDQVYLQLKSNKAYTFIPLSEEGLLRLNQTENKFVQEEKLTHESFQNDAFIFEVDERTEVVLTDQPNHVEIRLMSSEMDYLGVWSLYPARAGFVCLEPWAGVADREDTTGRYEEKFGNNKLDPSEKKRHKYTIDFVKKI